LLFFCTPTTNFLCLLPLISDMEPGLSSEARIPKGRAGAAANAAAAGAAADARFPRLEAPFLLKDIFIVDEAGVRATGDESGLQEMRWSCVLQKQSCRLCCAFGRNLINRFRLVRT
jgi:hypothetical protein